MDESEKRIAWQGAHLRVVADGRWEYVQRVRTWGAVAVLPVTAEGRVVLIEQHRVPVGCRVIELPAGLVGDEQGFEDEPAEAAARRELLEETGYEAGRLERLCDGVVTAGMSDERLVLYVATGCRKVGPGGGDGTEDIRVHEVATDEALAWIAAKRAQGLEVDVKAMLLLLCWLGPSPFGRAAGV